MALNRTAVGFGSGQTTFGWQFYPRVQTPPLQSNLSRIAGILISNGPGPDYDLKNRKIEPGVRECYALVVMPSFVPSVKFTSVTNWFDLKTKHADQVLETTDMIRLGRKLQAAKNGLQRVCDSGKYRPEEVELLSDRLSQLEDFLPVKSHAITLPFEGSLLGSEIFSSNAAGLAPRLLAWYGEPPQEGADSTIFILGNGFSVHEIHAIAGGVAIPDANLQLISRNVLSLTIPANARAVQTALTVVGSDGKPLMRKLLDVHVASPNGISNHLLVEVQPKASTDQAAATVTRSVQVSYSLLQQSLANGIAYVPVTTGLPSGEVDLAWDLTQGAPPATTSAQFTFPNLFAPGGADLSIPATGLTRKGGNLFALTGNPLDDFATSLIGVLANENYLTPSSPTVQLTSSKITLANPAPKGKPVDATSSGPVIVSVVPTLQVPQFAPGVFQVKLDNTGQATAVTTADLTLDWFSTAPSVHADLTIELSLDNKPLGSVTSLTFLDSAGDIAIVSGKRTITNKLFMQKLNNLLGLVTTTNKPTPGQSKVLKARTISIAPQLDNLQGLVPVLVESAFEIDTDPFTAKLPALTRKMTLPVAARGSAPIGSLHPAAAAQALAATGRRSIPGRGVGVSPLRDSSLGRTAAGKDRPVAPALAPSLPGGNVLEAAHPGAVAVPESSRPSTPQARPRLLQRLFGTRDSQ